MGTQNTGKRLFAVIGDPGKLAAVVVQKTGGEAYASSGGDIRKSRIVVRAVEIPDFPGIDQSVLDSFQRRRRASADHKGASVEVLFLNDILPSERIGFVCDQIDAAFEKLMDKNAGDLFSLLSQCKQDINFISQKGLNSVFILEYGRDLYIPVCF